MSSTFVKAGLFGYNAHEKSPAYRDFFILCYAKTFVGIFLNPTAEHL